MFVLQCFISMVYFNKFTKLSLTGIHFIEYKKLQQQQSYLQKLELIYQKTVAYISETGANISETGADISENKR